LLKCPTLLRIYSTGHFISHDVPSSLKASFKSINGLLDFYMVSEPQVSCDDEHFSPVVVHMFGH
jgi:hypothetical protein